MTVAISAARLRANQENAQKSTGPITDEGKNASRQNALKHGLRAETLDIPVTDDELVAIQAREQAWSRKYLIEDEDDRWNLHQMVVATVKIERCQYEETTCVAIERHRAETSWNEDRRAEIEALVEKLAHRPARVVAELKRTAHGCAWLILKWHKLLTVLEKLGEWDVHERRFVYDLMGLPRVLRRGDPLGLRSKPVADLALMVKAQLHALKTRQTEVLDAFDQELRELTIAGMNPFESNDLRRIRRYEALHWRRYQAAQQALRRLPPAGTRLPEPFDPPPAVPEIPPLAETTPSAPLPPNEPPIPVAPPSTPVLPIAALRPTPATPVPLAAAVRSSLTAPRNRKERRALQRAQAKRSHASPR